MTGGQEDKSSGSRRAGKRKGGKDEKPVYVDAAPLAALFQVRSAIQTSNHVECLPCWHMYRHAGPLHDSIIES